MPITGSIDVSDIIANLGDDSHGLRAGADRYVPEEEDDQVFLASSGPVLMSSQTALAPVWKPIWDGNGYYRALGVQSPYRPRKGDLRRAYQRSQGWKSERLTYYMKQLLTPKVREEYDALPLGKRLRDKYVIAEEVAQLAQVAAEESVERGEVVTVDRLITEHKMVERATRKPPQRSSEAGWIWGYYLLNSRKYDQDDLAAWQALLISVFSARSVVTRFSIGYSGITEQPFQVVSHDDTHIIFLHENHSPSLDDAEAAASTYITLTEGTTDDREQGSNPPRRPSSV